MNRHGPPNVSIPRFYVFHHAWANNPECTLYNAAGLPSRS